jgi:multiple sugar transport system substrate-binding protein
MSTKISRREFIKVGTAAAAALAAQPFLAGCGPTPTSAPTSLPAPAATATQVPKTSETIVFGTLVEFNPFKAFIPQWEEATGNKVDVVEVPFTSWQDKLYTDVQAGAGSYDVVFMDDPWMPFLAGNGYIAPLSEFGYEPDPDFVEGFLNLGKWPPPTGPRPPKTPLGQVPELYALPILGNVELLWYRKDIITPEPKTTDELIAAIQAHADPSNEMYGYVHQAGRGAVVNDFNVWNWTYGGDIFDEDWSVIVNGPKSVQALSDYIDLLPLAPPGVANFNLDEPNNFVLNGTALCCMAWPISNANIDDPTKSAVSGKIGIIPFPKKERQTTQSGNWFLAIPTSSKRKATAFDFAKWAVGADVQKPLLRPASRPPSRASSGIPSSWRSTLGILSTSRLPIPPPRALGPQNGHRWRTSWGSTCPRLSPMRCRPRMHWIRLQKR